MDTITTNISVQPGNVSFLESQAGNTKAGPSKFDQVRSKLGAVETGGSDSGSPDTAVQASAEVQKPQAGKSSLADETRPAVTSVSNTSSADPIRNRLMAIEDQYKKLDSAVHNLSGPADPQELLKLQQSVFQVSESLGVVTKVVDQATSSIKSILQTQI